MGAGALGSGVSARLERFLTLAEQSNQLALDSAMEAARADATGRTTVVVDQICRLAVGAGVNGGEIAELLPRLQFCA